MDTTVINMKNEKVSLYAKLACIYIISMPLTIITVTYGLSLLKIVSIIIGIILVPNMFFGKGKINLNSVHLFFAIYLLYCIGGLLIFRIDYTVFQIKGLIEAFIFVNVLSVRIYNQREKRWIESAWIIVGIICTIFGLISKEVVEATRITLSIFGFSEDPNQFCAYLILPLIYTIMHLTKGKKYRVLYVVLLLAMLLVLFKTGSRGGLIAIFAGAGFYILFGIEEVKRKVQAILFIGVLAVLFMVLIYPTLPEQTRERFSIERVEKDKGTGRFETWDILIRAAVKNPKDMIFGLGIGSTVPILEKTNSVARYAHNQWIQVFCDQGFVGLFLFGYLIFSAIARNFKRNQPAAAGMIGIIALSMSLTMYVFKPYMNILLMCAMTFRPSLATKEETENVNGITEEINRDSK